MLIKALLVVGGIVTLFIGLPAYAGRRIERSRQAGAIAAVADYRPGSSGFFGDVPTVVIVRRPVEEDLILAQLRRREELVRSNLDRIWVQFIEALGWKGAQAARALLVGSGELPISALAA